jgi:hypothetical protein
MTTPTDELRAAAKALRDTTANAPDSIDPTLANQNAASLDHHAANHPNGCAGPDCGLLALARAVLEDTP